MSSTTVPLSELAQRLALKQSELEEARRAYETRLADLARRKEELQAQLRNVDVEIQAVSSTAAAEPAAAVAPPAPVAPAALPNPPDRAEDAPTLVQFVLGLVRQAGRPITVKELAEEV